MLDRSETMARLTAKKFFIANNVAFSIFTSDLFSFLRKFKCYLPIYAFEFCGCSPLKKYGISKEKQDLATTSKLRWLNQLGLEFWTKSHSNRVLINIFDSISSSKSKLLWQIWLKWHSKSQNPGKEVYFNQNRLKKIENLLI